MVKINNRVFNALPETLPGFEHVVRYWDEKNNVYAAKIIQGEYYVTAHGEMITTVLGSCVAACIRDVRLGIGGMNHFMLPESRNKSDSWKNSPVNLAARYGNIAMERLINSILSITGNRDHLEAKLFGGGNLLDISTDIGQLNINFVKTYLDKEKINVVSEDLGDIYPRKLVYFPSTGIARVKKLMKMHNDTLLKRENNYKEELDKEAVHPDFELFKT